VGDIVSDHLMMIMMMGRVCLLFGVILAHTTEKNMADSFVSSARVFIRGGELYDVKDVNLQVCCSSTLLLHDIFCSYRSRARCLCCLLVPCTAAKRWYLHATRRPGAAGRYARHIHAPSPSAHVSSSWT
jgi:hypothetical protein